MLNIEELPACPVATAVRLIGNKWKILIVRDLLSGAKRNGELLRSLDGISQKVLTENLRSMEDDGLVDRFDYCENPPRVEYALSELGNTMKPILHSLEVWGSNYQEIVRQGTNPPQ